MIPSQLPTFIQVVQQGNFSAASRKLGISPAAVSHAIAQLEKLLKQRLFHRSTHSLTLTEEGRLLYERTAGLVEALDESISSSMDEASQVRGKIKINLPIHFGQTVIYPKLLEFLRIYPDIEMDLHFDDSTVDLVEHGFDLGIGNSLNDDSRLIARRLFDLEPVLVCSKQYVEQHGIPETPEQLMQHECIVYRSPTSGRIAPWNFIKDGSPLQISPRQRLVINNPKSAFIAAKSGFGITSIGRNYLDENPENLITVLDSYKSASIPVWLYYSSRSYLPERIKRLIDFLLPDISQ